MARQQVFVQLARLLAQPGPGTWERQSAQGREAGWQKARVGKAGQGRNGPPPPTRSPRNCPCLQVCGDSATITATWCGRKQVEGATPALCPRGTPGRDGRPRRRWRASCPPEGSRAPGRPAARAAGRRSPATRGRGRAGVRRPTRRAPRGRPSPRHPAGPDSQEPRTCVSPGVRPGLFYRRPRSLRVVQRLVPIHLGEKAWPSSSENPAPHPAGLRQVLVAREMKAAASWTQLRRPLGPPLATPLLQVLDPLLHRLEHSSLQKILFPHPPTQSTASQKPSGTLSDQESKRLWPSLQPSHALCPWFLISSYRGSSPLLAGQGRAGLGSKQLFPSSQRVVPALLAQPGQHFGTSSKLKRLAGPPGRGPLEGSGSPCSSSEGAQGPPPPHCWSLGHLGSSCLQSS
ncbi:uncharacterized protein LOC142445574 [Tenrec ecaudatus]|uniref:uncharacterized protein LOC142445574 n=1 Tax=Tenrec ecaudatus TaxID=94439 RepID=UPI003F5A83B7